MFVTYLLNSSRYMASGGRRQNSPPRMMIVDDEKVILSILTSGLETRGGFVVDTFYSGGAALQSFVAQDSNHYDLILTDIMDAQDERL
jgi:CheY-like chemotaxis protein